MTDQNAYLMEEAKLIGSRIQWYLEQHEKFEAFAILSSGGVWAFVLSQPWNYPTGYIAWIPAVISAIFYFKSILFTKTLNEAFDYLYILEKEFKLPKGLGWVHYFRTKSSKYKRRWRHIFWLIMFLGNIAIRLFFPFTEILKHKL